MYAQLGDIKFNLITYFNSIEQTKKRTFAKQDVIEGPAVMQDMGEDNATLNLGMHFHSEFCEPSEEVKKVVEARDKGEPLTLIYGTGEIVGDFVIEEIGKAVEQTDKRGGLISSSISLKLTQAPKYTLPQNQKKKKTKKTTGKKQKSNIKKPNVSKINYPAKKIVRQA